jgi:WD40 repeat protein/serine/threonine protein kinase
MIATVLQDTYVLTEEVERGPFSTVYVGIDMAHEQETVTVHVVHPYLTGDGAFLHRFYSETERLAKVNSFRVAPVLAYGDEDGVQFVIYDVPHSAQTLRSVLREVGRLPLLRAMAIARGIAEGLMAAHAANLYHRCLRPESIFLKDDDVYLADYGLAWAVNLSAHANEEWVRAVPYVAPEILRGERSDAQTDLYNFGVLFAEMLTGQAPMSEHTPDALPSEVFSLIRRCLSSKREARPPSARGLMNELDRSLQRLVPGTGPLKLRGDLTGQMLGNYEILSLLGRGGMAEVYLARQSSLDRRVAVKVLLPHVSRDPLVVARFQREAQVVSQLRHPNILPVFDFVSRDGGAYIVMQYADAGTLKDRLGQPMSMVQAMPILTQIGAVLDHAHGAGIVHRDVKPSNILLDHTGRAYLADFGLAFLSENVEKLTLSGMAMGTPDYMAPEQAQGKAATGESDLYALGVIAYEMLTGTVPYEADSAIGVAMKHITEPVPPASTRNNAIVPAMEEVLYRVLAKQPANRFGTAHEFLVALSLAGDVEYWFKGLMVQQILQNDTERRPVSGPGRIVTPSLAALPASLSLITPDNAAALRKLQRLGRGRATQPAFSPDGKHLVLSTSIGIELWNTKTWKLKYLMREHGGLVEGVAYSPDGRQLASASWDSTVRLWNATSGEVEAVLTGHLGSVLTVQFSPTGKVLASGGEDNTVRLWDTQTHDMLATLKGHRDFVRALAFSPDGRVLASGSADGTVQLWDSYGCRAGPVLRGPSGPVGALAYSPDGRLLASAGSAKVISLWDPRTGRAFGYLSGHTRSVLALAFNPTGKVLASGGEDNVVRLWDARAGAELQRLVGHSEPIISLAFSPDGMMLVSVGRDRTVRLWNVETGLEVHCLDGYTPQVMNLAFSPDGQAIATGADDSTIRMWSLTPPSLFVSISGHRGLVYSVAFGDNNLLASASRDHTVRLWDAFTGREHAIFKEHTGPVYAVTFSPDGRYFASGGTNGQVILWDTATQRLLRVMAPQTGDVGALAFHPGSRVLAAAGTDEGIRLLDVDTGQLLRQVWGAHDGPVRGLDFSPDGQLLASAGGDACVRIWDANQLGEVARLTGHVGSVNDVSFSPDSRLLASCCDDNTVRVWEVATRRELTQLPGHTAWVNSVSFSPDGRLIASGSMDGTLRLWGVED